MNFGVKKTGFGLALFLTAALVFIMGTVPVNSHAAKMTEEQIRNIVATSVQLLMKNEEPTEEQSRKIQDLKEMVSQGSIGAKQISGIAKDRFFADMEKYRISRYEIGNMLKRVPELLPSVTGKEVHTILWEKVIQMLEEPFVLKTGTLAPQGTPWIIFPETKLNKHLNKVSKGKLVSKVYAGGVMGEDIDILRKMDMGQLDGCGCSALGTFKAIPELAVFSLPRLFRDYDEVDHIFKTFRKEIDAAAEEKGYLVDFLIDTGFSYIWLKNEANSLAALRKQKMLTWMGDVETATFKELGIRPIPIPVPEVVASLSTGLINTNVGPAPWVLGTQAYLHYKYYIAQPLNYSPAVQIYTRKNFEDRFRGKYPDALIQNFIELRIYEIRTLEREYIDNNLRPYEAKCLAAFQKQGIKPVQLSDKDMAEIDAASKRVWEKLSDKVYSKAFLDKILKELENYRSKKK
ncbi:MAG: TRAP transporter substrate-binding protein DctP [Desulfobacterales bacterium]